MTLKELKLAGALLYACEGTKARRDNRWKNHLNYSIELTNSRPEIIALFYKFLIEVLNVDPNRLRGQLFLYPDHDREKLISFWSGESKIPVSQFHQIISLTKKGSKYKPNPLGTFKIRYNSKQDFLRLQNIIQRVWKDAGVV